MIIRLTAVRFDATTWSQEFEIIGGGRRTTDLGSVDDHEENDMVRTLRRWQLDADTEPYGNMPNRIVRIFVNRESTATSRWDEFASVGDVVIWLSGQTCIRDEVPLNSRITQMSMVI
jgi:hypothetical protein